jgi:hypothetical protein
MQGSQHDHLSRDARELPSGVDSLSGKVGPGLSSEPCNNACSSRQPPAPSAQSGSPHEVSQTTRDEPARV